MFRQGGDECGRRCKSCRVGKVWEEFRVGGVGRLDFVNGGLVGGVPRGLFAEEGGIGVVVGHLWGCVESSFGRLGLKICGKAVV